MNEKKIKTKWLLLSCNDKIEIYYSRAGQIQMLAFEDLSNLKMAVQSRYIKTKNSVLILPANLTISRNITLPADSFDEAAKMLDFEIENLLPVDISEFVYSCLPVKIEPACVTLAVHIIRKTDAVEAVKRISDTGLHLTKLIPDISRITDFKTITPENIKKMLLSLSVTDNFNLMPPSILAEMQKQKLLKTIFITTVLCIFFTFSVLFSIHSIKRRFAIQKRALLAQIEPIRDIAQTVDAKKQQLSALHRQLLFKGLAVKTISELYKITSKSISISELQFIKDKSKVILKLKAKTGNISKAFEYIDTAKSSYLLKALSIVHIQQSPVPNGKSIVDFSVSCPITEFAERLDANDK